MVSYLSRIFGLGRLDLAEDVAQGEFHLLAGRPAEAAKHFEKAMKLGRSRSETNFFERKLKACQPGTAQINNR